jgi:ankyrin repeat protein
MGTMAGRDRSHCPGPISLRTIAGYLVLALPIAGIYGFVSLARQAPGKPNVTLFQAAQAGDMDAVRAHGLAGTPLNVLDPEGHTALYDAISEQHYVAAEVLLKEGASPDSELQGGQTPLMLAAGQGQIHLVDELIAHGADPNRAMSTGFTALHAGVESRNPAVVSLLLDRGAEPNAPLSKFAATPLCVAAWRGDAGCEQALLQAGAKVNVRTYLGRTPLHLASISGNREAVALLIKAGASTQALDDNHLTALDLERK